MLTISIAYDFSRTPGPRYESEGTHSGETFRKTILAPFLLMALARREKLLINLDKTAGYGTSFLEEAFAGLIRENKMPYMDIVNTIELVSEDEPWLIDDIKHYIAEADKNIC